MKRALLLFLSAICMLTFLTACDDSSEQPSIDLLKTVKIDVSHIVRGQTDTWIIDNKKDIEALSEWLIGLSLKLKQFDEGSSPGDADGGEVYSFEIGNDGNSFTYYIGGPNNCYIVYGGQWYQVKNPTSPPVE